MGSLAATLGADDEPRGRVGRPCAAAQEISTLAATLSMVAIVPWVPLVSSIMTEICP